MATQPRYRVEHREAGQTVAIGCLVDDFAHRTALDPFVSRLLLEGDDGEVVLIDETTGAVIARRQVRPFGVKPRDRFRQFGDRGRSRPQRLGQEVGDVGPGPGRSALDPVDRRDGNACTAGKPRD